uniref:Uncharacterized protein n=1 Tax=Lepeophtheirus salmonis TaxID=72036 RepID=A0A0K2SZU4_LEPSM
MLKYRLLPNGCTLLGVVDDIIWRHFELRLTQLDGLVVTSPSYDECLEIENIIFKVQEMLYVAKHTNEIIPPGIQS